LEPGQRLVDRSSLTWWTTGGPSGRPEDANERNRLHEPRGGGINTVSPGPVETALWLGDHGVAVTVANAYGDPEEVAKQAAASP